MRCLCERLASALKSKGYKGYIGVCSIFLLFTSGAFAQDVAGINPLSSMAQIPKQQFVTADDDSAAASGSGNAVASTSAPSAESAVPLQSQQPQSQPPSAESPEYSQSQGDMAAPQTQAVSSQGSTNGSTLSAQTDSTMPAPAAEQTLTEGLSDANHSDTLLPADANANNASQVPASTTAPALQPAAETIAQSEALLNHTLPTVTQQPATIGSANPLSAQPVAPVTPAQTLTINPSGVTTEFVGGVNANNLGRCQKMVKAMCFSAPDAMRYKQCLSTFLVQVPCRQFLTFAALTDFGPKDDIDVIEQYPAAKLTLIRVKRWGINFPGDYYTIGSTGGIINITSGAEARAINIRKDLTYPQLAERYPQAQLWSLVEELPTQQVFPKGEGVRLIFRFKVLNGCSTCQLIAYANVAYDYSAEGDLKQVSLLSLQPL